MRQVIVATLIIAVAAVLLLPRVWPGFAIGAVVMPGPLTGAHAEYERNCSQCHSPFNRETQSNLCIYCHNRIREDLEDGCGFHGRSPSVVEKPCKSCHTEHLGRDGVIVSLNERTFDHDFTDFRRVGAHARMSVSCEACHAAGEKFRNTPRDCFGCHEDDDNHNGALGTDCASCHTENSWGEVNFTHETTCFPLTGRHRETACESCHPNRAYLNASSDCNTCHLMNDIHGADPAQKCDGCHGTDSWKEAAFDHNRETQFVLKDRHIELNCDACHPGFKFGQSAGVKCVDCHRANDVHKGTVGLDCENCHSSVEWREAGFDHNKDTGFALSGRHVRLKCIDCHEENSGQEKKAADCNSCHQTDDVHRGQLGPKCDSCHNTDGWTERIIFDHDLTRFPLIGLHAIAACGECHLSSAYKETETTCVACHDSDDYHKEALGTDCASCHNPNGWRLWQFDHNVRTKFKLEGAHAKLECNSCHAQQAKGKIKLPTACSACHSEDDVHYRRFGKQCDRCHTAESFKQIRMGG